MQEWKIKFTGKLIYLLIFTLFCVGIVFLYAGYMSFRFGGSIIGNLVGLSFIGILFIFAWFFTFPALILRKKVPKKITLSSQEKFIEFHFRRKKPLKIHFENLAYNVNHYAVHSTINFYYVHRSTRGHVLYKRVIDLFGLKWHIGWEPSLIKEIQSHLEKLDVELKSERDKSFFGHILGS